jgi:hypothetical protein
MMTFTHVTTGRYSNSAVKTFEVYIANYSSWITVDLMAIITRLITLKTEVGFNPHHYSENDDRSCRIVFLDARKSTTPKQGGIFRHVKQPPLVHARGSFSMGDMLAEIQLQHPEHLSANVTENLLAAANPVDAPREMVKELVSLLSACIGGGYSRTIGEQMLDSQLSSVSRFRGRPPRELVRIRNLEVARRKLDSSHKRVRGAFWDLHAGKMHYRAARQKDVGSGFGTHGANEEAFELLREEGVRLMDSLLADRAVLVGEINRLLEGEAHANV